LRVGTVWTYSRILPHVKRDYSLLLVRCHLMRPAQYFFKLLQQARAKLTQTKTAEMINAPGLDQTNRMQKLSRIADSNSALLHQRSRRSSSSLGPSE